MNSNAANTSETSPTIGEGQSVSNASSEHVDNSESSLSSASTLSSETSEVTVTLTDSQYEQISSQLDFINTGVVLCLVLCCLIFGAMLVRFFLERVY